MSNYNQFVPIEDYKTYGTGMFWGGVVTGFIGTSVLWFSVAYLILSTVTLTHNFN